MDYLREGIGLRAYSQRDPLVEYQREGFELFQAMMESIKEEAVGFLFHVEVQTEQPRRPGRGRAAERGRRAGRRRSRHGAATTASHADGAGGRRVAVEDDDEDADESRTEPVRAEHRPHIRRQGSRGAEAAEEPLLLGAELRRRRRHPGPPGHRGRGRLRRRVPQRAVPVWVGPEVQALPRRPGSTQRLDRLGRRVRSAGRQPNAIAVQSQRSLTWSRRAATARDRCAERDPGRDLGAPVGGRPGPSRPVGGTTGRRWRSVPGDPALAPGDVGVDAPAGPTHQLGQRAVARDHLDDGLDEGRGPRLRPGADAGAPCGTTTRAVVAGPPSSRPARVGQGQRPLGVRRAGVPGCPRAARSGGRTSGAGGRRAVGGQRAAVMRCLPERGGSFRGGSGRGRPRWSSG